MEKTDELLFKVLEKSLSVIENTGDFVIDQAPDLLQEFYRWHLIKESILSLMFFASLAILYKAYKNAKKLSLEEDDDIFFAMYIILIICSFVFLFIGLSSIYNLIFLLSAPKLYLIDCLIN